MKNNLGFTLVELIVVVTILAILGTIGFVSYSSYLTGVRDANRTSSLEAISSGLSLYTTSAKSLPIPDQVVKIYSGSTADENNLLAYQGQAGVTVIETIDYSKAWEDPTDNEPFRYLIDRARKYHQMVAYAEDSDTSIAYNLLFPQANAIDLSLRYPIFYGEKLGMFIETAIEQQPLDAALAGASQLTVATLVSTYNVHFDENTEATTLTATAYGNTLAVWGLVSSCAVLNAKKNLTSTGTYLTSSGWTTEESQCGEDSV